MKCPHCLITYFEDPEYSSGENLTEDADGEWSVEYSKCPSCNKIAIYLVLGKHTGAITMPNWNELKRVLVNPKGINRAPVPPEVPHNISEDYREACLVLADSPKASAALSRRCLQSILRDHAKVKRGKLSLEIQEAIDSGKLPSHISDLIDVVRVIGNFAAHPEKDENTGQIIQVEPKEAEINLDVLESLFDFYFVLPKQAKVTIDKVNKKLTDAGNNSMKGV